MNTERTAVKLARIEEIVKSVREDVTEIKRDIKLKNNVCSIHSRDINTLKRDWKWVGFLSGIIGSIITLVVSVIFNNK